MGPPNNYLIALNLFPSATLENTMIPNVTIATEKNSQSKKKELLSSPKEWY